MKILLIKFRNIGDVLLSTPLIENLTEIYDHPQIDFAINAECKDMLSLNPNINRLIVYNRRIKTNLITKIKLELDYIKSIRKTNYDIIINLTEGDRGILTSLFSKSKLKLGFKPRNGILKYINVFDKHGDDYSKVHTIDKDLQFITLLEKSIVSKHVSIYWDQDDIEIVDQLLEKFNVNSFIQIHPVSRWMFKCWEDERMAKVIDYLQDNKGKRIIITASPDKIEQNRVHEIIRLCKSQPINFMGQLSLRQLAYLSSRSEFYFGIDSAPMHMAAAVNTPVFALMGGSEPVYWGPWDNYKMESTYLNVEGKQFMGENIVISDTNHDIFYDNGVKKCRGMINITYENVLGVLNEKL